MRLASAVVPGLIALLVLLAAASAGADQLVFGVDHSIRSQSNLFKIPDDDDPTSDLSYEIRPSINLHRRGYEKLSYELLYEPSYDLYVENRDLNDLDHLFRSRVEYKPWRAGRLWLRTDLADYRSVRSSDRPADGIPDVQSGGKGRVNRFFADLGYDHELDSLTRIETRLQLQNYAFTRSNNIDSLGFGGELALLRSVSPIADAGLALFSSLRRYEEATLRPPSRNLVVNPNLVVGFEPIETLRLDVRVGPAWLQTRQSGGDSATVGRFLGAETSSGPMAAVFDPVACQDGEGRLVISECPVAPATGLSDRLGERVAVDFAPGERPASIDDSHLTVFALADLTKTESWGRLGLEYYRREDAASGNGSTTIRDSITGRVLFRPGWRFDVRVRGNWNRRKVTSEVNRALVAAGPSGVDAGGGLFFAESVGLVPSVLSDEGEIRQVWFDTTVGRPILFEGLRLELRFQYLDEERRDRGSDGSFENYMGEMRLRYRFAMLEL